MILETIIVTAIASRVPEDIDASPAPVSVITRDQLDRTLSHDIAQALRYEPGISVENGPARFGLGNIAIRGLDGNRVQVMLDGVRMPDGFRVGSFSNASRNAFDTGLLSRIEVLRGPGSALYGSDALAGVVSMTTLAPGELLGLAGRTAGFASGGYEQADRSWRGAGAAAARSGDFEFLAAASRTVGHERDNQGEVNVAGTARTSPNPQDATTTSALAKAILRMRGNGQMGATFEHFERQVVTDVASLNPQSARTVSLSGDDASRRTRGSLEGVSYLLGPVDRLSWLVYGQRSLVTQDTNEVRANTTAQCLSAPGPVTCRREVRFSLEQAEAGATVIGQTALGGKQQFVYGLEWSRNRAEESRDGRQTDLATGNRSNVVGTDVFPTRDFPPSRVERIGAFAQDEITLPFATLIPALRYDRFRMRPEPDASYATANPGRTPVALDDGAWSPKLGALVPLTRGLTLALQASAGFRAPPYFDVNVGLSNLPLGYSVIPNPDLAPERSRGYEAALRGRHAALDWSLTAYRTDYRDLIVSRAPLACPGDPRCVPTAPITFQSQNVTRARIEGIEARAEARIAAGWTARLGASASRGDDLTRRVPLNSVDPAKVVAGLAWEGGGRGIELHVTHAAKKTRIDQSTAAYFQVPAYTTADLTAFVAVARRVTVNAGVFNLFDRKYWLWSDVRGVANAGPSADRYTQPGRSAGIQVKVVF